MMQNHSALRCLILAILCCIGACAHQPVAPNGPRMTEAQVLAIAEPALHAKFGDYMDEDRLYRAMFRDGVWYVFGTLPPGALGGTPSVEVRDADGVVTAIYHTQ